MILRENKEYFAALIFSIGDFLKNELKLRLHPDKIVIRKYHQGIDFLGYIVFPHHRLLRTKTKRRIFKKLQNGVSEQSLQSYLGVLSHANTHELREQILNEFCQF